MKHLAFVLLSSALPAVVATASAQNALDRAKDQYESAAYEEALSTLGDAGNTVPADKVQVEQYRALCLIALGRLPEAERAISALVAADPTYVPSASVASPKVLSIVSDIRKKELPSIIRGLLDQGRQAYQRKELASARQTFELVLTLAEDPSLNGRPELEDVKVVARGFADLAAATAAPPPAPVVPEAPPPPPAAAPSNAKTAPSVGFIPAVAIRQDMPVWEPPARTFATIEYTGSIKVRIGVDGKVQAVAIERPSHPAYDARLLEVASTWLYKPATRNGEPIESEKVIAVRLRPLH
jgi:tetratricopeptide (TPR) repeat protein